MNTHASTESTAPPFRPDPEIVSNIEGNKKIKDEDKEAVRKYLDDHDLRAPADDPTTVSE